MENSRLLYFWLVVLRIPAEEMLVDEEEVHLHPDGLCDLLDIDNLTQLTALLDVLRTPYGKGLLQEQYKDVMLYFAVQFMPKFGSRPESTLEIFFQIIESIASEYMSEEVFMSMLDIIRNMFSSEADPQYFLPIHEHLFKFLCSTAANYLCEIHEYFMDYLILVCLIRAAIVISTWTTDYQDWAGNCAFLSRSTKLLGVIISVAFLLEQRLASESFSCEVRTNLSKYKLNLIEFFLHLLELLTKTLTIENVSDSNVLSVRDCNGVSCTLINDCVSYITKLIDGDFMQLIYCFQTDGLFSYFDENADDKNSHMSGSTVGIYFAFYCGFENLFDQIVQVYNPKYMFVQCLQFLVQIVPLSYATLQQLGFRALEWWFMKFEEGTFDCDFFIDFHISQVIEKFYMFSASRFTSDLNYCVSVFEKFYKLFNYDGRVMIFRFLMSPKGYLEVIPNNVSATVGYLLNKYRRSLLKNFQKEMPLDEPLNPVSHLLEILKIVTVFPSTKDVEYLNDNFIRLLEVVSFYDVLAMNGILDVDWLKRARINFLLRLKKVVAEELLNLEAALNYSEAATSYAFCELRPAAMRFHLLDHVLDHALSNIPE
ncbi:hypothetical protein T4B_4671 [Trichinella pseudospiralis]|uniref:Uncharacterized protein n=1 Tax=Trichinella pseudospiralis TaxID=6337 RepID=A0A0V1IKB4_TRIPS|nr:hypothetical protein T4B_4671 [Trichinella pseudospiralis]